MSPQTEVIMDAALHRVCIAEEQAQAEFDNARLMVERWQKIQNTARDKRDRLLNAIIHNQSARTVFLQGAV